ncbi:hypothetical protein F3526_22760 [Vibrio parahaemolyticus]|nr:hypothetical protein [Vibrio parahaemolyticus]EGQ9121215.1 hypothetical protein [Vibrio parahaemolyticus]EGQ9478670.1 hypothetical protein [Vibrio parahaemolyticus]EGR3458171.1 hypothetical protein [Vibrio parahaemolyticus]
MYLIKLSNNVFYTRISTPAILQTSLGYPREIRLSLFTKYRRLAALLLNSDEKPNLLKLSDFYTTY